MKKPFRRIFVLLLSLMVVLTGCGGNGSNTGNAGNDNSADVSGEEATPSHLNVALFLWMEGLDPAIGWNGWTSMRCGIAETLLTANEDMEIVEQLADSWEQVDELTYRFHIRQGVKFSNGNDLTPQAVKESIERTAEMNSRGGNLKLDSVEVDGEYVIFKTTEPYSSFIYYLTEPMCAIVDTSVDTSNFDSAPVCTGPYVCVEYVPEEKYELVANEYYWGGVPDVDAITVLNVSDDTKVDGMLAGDLDVAAGASVTTLSLVEGNENIDIVKATGTRENDLEINCREGRPTADVNLRRALSYAIDREVIAQIAGNGYAQPLGTAFPDSVGYNSEAVNGQTYDVEKAKEYLALAGYADADGNGYVEMDGEELVLTISLKSNSSTAVYQAMQDMWKEIGIHVEIALLENLTDIRESGDFDFINGAWQTVNNADGQSYLKNRWSDGGPDNYTGYHSDAFEEVMDDLDAAFDEEARIEAFVAAQQIIADDCPAIFLYANDNITLINNTRVSGVTVFPIDYYMITGDWKAVE